MESSTNRFPAHHLRWLYLFILPSLRPQSVIFNCWTPRWSTRCVDLQRFFYWQRRRHLCMENFTCLQICMVWRCERQVRGTVDAVTFCKSPQWAGVALQSSGQAREFQILKPEVSEKLPGLTDLWQQVCIPKKNLRRRATNHEFASDRAGQCAPPTPNWQSPADISSAGGRMVPASIFLFLSEWVLRVFLFFRFVYPPPPPQGPVRVGWAYVGSHHRDTLLRIPLPGTVLSG